MLTIHPASRRGLTETGWLDSRHTFSFGHWYDPSAMGFRGLRVINDDRVAPGGGFGTHPHRDMEIISYVVEGALQHRDSMGNGSVIRPGEVQRMSAGRGVLHSEENPSSTAPVRFLQIWLPPRSIGGPPGYAQARFDDRQDRLRLVVSPDGAEGSLTADTDTRLLAGLLGRGTTVQHDLAPGRFAWVQVVRGAVTLDGAGLREGDGASLRDATHLTLTATEDAEVLVFDLA